MARIVLEHPSGFFIEADEDVAGQVDLFLGAGWSRYEAPEDLEESEEVDEADRSEELQELKVAELRTLLEGYELDTDGRKDELIERVLSYEFGEEEA